MIKYYSEKVDFDRLIDLFNEAGWTDKTKDLNRLEQMVKNSQIVVTAWDGGLMIGFARCITDFVFNGQINNVVVDSRYRQRGIGKTLVSKIFESNTNVTYILRGDPENEKFYKKLGFELVNLSFVYRRKA